MASWGGNSPAQKTLVIWKEPVNPIWGETSQRVWATFPKGDLLGIPNPRNLELGEEMRPTF